MKRIALAASILCVALGVPTVAQKASASQSLSAEAALGAAIHQEEVEGNIEAAIASFKKFIAQYGSNRPLAAKAQYRLGLAYEKLGDAQARAAYERVMREFADQKDVASQASRRLEALRVPRQGNTDLLRTVLAAKDLDIGGISQDGRWMALTEWGDGDLVIRDMTSGETRQLVKGTCGPNSAICRFAEQSVLSPDARQIAYSWYDDAVFDGRAQLHIIASQAGATPRVLIRHAEFNFDPIGWSPDARFIMATLRKENRTTELVRVSVADGSWTLVKSFGWRQPQVSLSPDGRYIAYSALPGNPSLLQPGNPLAERHIYVLSVDDGKEIELVKTAAANRLPMWMPDGAHIAFVSNLSGKFDLWSVSVRDGDNASPSLLRRDIGDVVPVGVTRAGSYYYVQRKPGVEQVTVAELASPGQRQRPETFVGVNPTWSPDGQFIAFSRHRGDAWDLIVRSVATRDERVYTHEGLHPGPPRWFQDNKRLLQDIVMPGRPRTSTALDIERREFKETWTSDAYLTGIAALSPDNATLYFPSGHRDGLGYLFDRVMAADLNAGKERQVVSIPETRARGFGFAVSRDGRMLAIITTDSKSGDSRLAVAGIDGAGYREIYGPFRARQVFDQMTWTMDNRSILFAVSDGDLNGNYRIMRIGRDGGIPESTGVTVKGLSTFDLSPDGSRIAYSTLGSATNRGELFAIDNLPSLVK